MKRAYVALVTGLWLLLISPLAVHAIPGPTNFWPADGTAVDVVGGNNGVLVNGAGYGPGVTGQAFSFNGVNQYMQAASAIPLGSGDFTIDLWANFNSVPPSSIGNPSSVFIADDNGAGCQEKWLFTLGGGVLNFNINTASCAAGFFAQYPWTPNLHQWYNLAVTRNEGTITIFVNCVAVSSQITASTSNPTAPLTVGFGETGSGYFNGLIDDVRIYNSALAPSSLLTLCSPSGTTGVPEFPYGLIVLFAVLVPVVLSMKKRALVPARLVR